MMVRVDQPRQDDMLTSVEYLRDGSAGVLALGQDFADTTLFDDQSASGVQVVGGEDGKGMFQPGAGRRHGAGSSENGFR